MPKRYRTDLDNHNYIHITEYQSLNEFLHDINSLPNNRFYQHYQSSQRIDEDGWAGTKTYKEAVELMSKGWDAGAEKLSQKVKLTNTVQSTVRSSRPAYGVIGSQASVPRYLQGIPTNMVSRQMTYSKQKVITITKGISYSGSTNPQRILDESAKALQIIQAMENAGTRVRLNVIFSATTGNFTSICKVCVKQPDERLSISKMSFPLAHPSMLRRFFFRWVETDPFADDDLGYGYGTPSPLYIKEKALAENEYFIPEFIDNIDDTIKTLQAGKKCGSSK